MELLCKTGFESPGHNTKLSGIGSVIQSSGIRGNNYETYITLCSLSLPENHSYLVLGSVVSQQGVDSGIMLALITGPSGDCHSRTTLSHGGGCSAWVYGSNGGTYVLKTFGYTKNVFNFSGKLIAIQLT